MRLTSTLLPRAFPIEIVWIIVVVGAVYLAFYLWGDKLGIYADKPGDERDAD